MTNAGTDQRQGSSGELLPLALGILVFAAVAVVASPIVHGIAVSEAVDVRAVLALALAALAGILGHLAVVHLFSWLHAHRQDRLAEERLDAALREAKQHAGEVTRNSAAVDEGDGSSYNAPRVHLAGHRTPDTGMLAEELSRTLGHVVIALERMDNARAVMDDLGRIFSIVDRDKAFKFNHSLEDKFDRLENDGSAKYMVDNKNLYLAKEMLEEEINTIRNIELVASRLTSAVNYIDSMVKFLIVRAEGRSQKK